MKKVILFCACAALAASASAQMSLVKDLAKKAGSNDVAVLQDVMMNIGPALTNGESMNNALTWFTAGKAALGMYDQLNARMNLGQEVDKTIMGESLIKGFNYYQKALELDQVVEKNKDGSPKLNKDGSVKVKTKYTNDINSALVGHIGDFANMGNVYLEAQDWANAATAYGGFCDIAGSELAAKNGLSFADSTVSEVRFMQAYSLYQNKDFEAAVPIFKKALDMGYTRNNCAAYMNDAFVKVVSAKLEANDNAGAFSYIDNAIAADPKNALMYDVKGQVYLQNEDYDNAIATFDQANQVDPSFADAFVNKARAYYEKGVKFIQTHDKMSAKELGKNVTSTFTTAKDLFVKADGMLDATQQADMKSNIKRYLDDIDYKLENLK